MNALSLTPPLQPFTRLMTERIGWTLVHFLWQGLLITILYAAARMWLSGKATAQARYVLACSALIAMLAAPIATFSILRPHDAAWVPTPYVVRTSATVQTMPATSPANSGLLAPNIPIVVTSPVRANRVLTWFVLFWMAGALAFSLRLIAGCLAAARLRFRAVRPAPPEWQQKLSELGAKIRVSRPTRLMVSAWAQTPAVVGWIKPVILVPVGALTGLAPDQIEALLLHELAHIRRHDYLVNILQSVVEALLFYHPAVWWISGHIRAEREACCDDVAVAASGDVLTYVRALTELASVRPSGFSSAVAAGGGSLSHRVTRLLGASQPKSESRPASAGIIVGALLLAITTFGVFAQTANPRPPFNAFEVATIKPMTPDYRRCGLCMEGNHRFIIAGTLQFIIVWAYNTTPDLVIGGPSWVNSNQNMYDIVAEAPNEVRPTQQENMVMLQKLLADRFKLVIHRQAKEVNVYNLTVAKGGPKNLRPAAHQEDDPSFGGSPEYTLKATAAPLDRFCAMLMRNTRLINRPVLNKTNLSGKFDFELVYESRIPPPPDSEKPDFFTAVTDQLGLKLEPGRGTVDEIVIDSVERPSEN